MTNTSAMKKIRIGDLLVESGKITEEQLMEALAEQKRTGQRLGKTLVSMGITTETVLQTMLSQQLGIPFVDLSVYNYNAKAVRSLKETLARRFRVAVLENHEDKIILAMSDPSDIFSLDEISRQTRKHIEPVIVRESELLDLLDSAYGESEKIASLAGELNDEMSDHVDIANNLLVAEDNEDAPVVKLISKIFEEALRFHASDIHIEPDENVLRIRLRIDGVLTEQVVDEKNIANALVVRLKLMSNLDISEKRLPQDGRFNMDINGAKVDVRLSTLPVQYGESVVMRLLILTDGVRNLQELNMPEAIAKSFSQAIRAPHGLILVTGPTGSGKTTTLYAAIAALNQPGKKIITVEDPVEYRLPRLSQVQVNEKIGLDFHSVLRSTLRQDPDVLLVGEIRDSTSADIALRAAMTGHLVFSTLHTNDAASTALRLLDMDVDEYLVASSLKTIIAQRLVRKLCTHCKTLAPVPEEYEYLLPEAKRQTPLYQPVGCLHCFNTGFRGRLGLFEFLQITPLMADALRTKNINEFNRLIALDEQHRSLGDMAMDLVFNGETSLEEVSRYSLGTERAH